MIKTITFDFGGVLYRYDGDVLLRALSGGSDIGVEDFRNLMAGSSLDRAHFRGELKAGELLEILRDEVGLSLTEEELAEVYSDSVKPNEKMFDLVRALEGDYNLQLYSDTPEILYEKVIKKMPIIDAFSAVTLSFEVGELKDSPHGYRDLIEKSSHSPEEIIFIDDREKYVEKAKELGINGIQFTEFDKLINQLESHGVRLDGKLDFDQGGEG